MTVSNLLLPPARWIGRGIEKGVARRFGWRLTKTQPQRVPAAVDLRDRANDPRTVSYYEKPIVIDALVAHARCKRIPMALDHTHPFARAVLNAASSKEPQQAIEQTLSRYYDTVQPTSLFDCFGVPNHLMPVSLATPQTTHNALLPWSSPEVTDKSITPILQDNQVVYAPITDHGNQHLGPVSPEKLRLEVHKLQVLMRSMAKNGLQRHDGDDGDIVADVLWGADGSWRWLVRQGQHRAAVAAALGFEGVPVRVASIIRRDDVDAWPNVLAGLFPRALALDIFDRFFAATAPPVLRRWLTTVEELRSAPAASVRGLHE